MMPPTHVILGAGYLAPFLWRALPATARVLAVRRHWAQAPDDARVATLAADIALAADRARLLQCLDGFAGTVFFTLPPSALGDAAETLLATLAADLARAGTRRMVVASSTGIWSDTALAVVDERSLPRLDSARTRRLAAVETAWRAAGLSSIAVRLAGLWGPGRVIGRDRVASGAGIAGQATGWLNLVRAEDAARALVAAATLAPPLDPLLISDGRPLQRGEYYAALADALGVARPRFDGSPPARGGGDRRCDPAPSWRRLGCVPLHGDVARELVDLVRDAGDGAKGAPTRE